MLEYALASCLAQTHRPLELVVVNDGGADISDLLPATSDPEVRVRAVRHDVSMGRCQAGNAGLEAASGDYLIFLDDDDWFEPRHLAGLVEALSSQPEKLAAFAGVRYCEQPEAEDIHVFNTAYDAVAQRLENRIPIHAVLFSRRLLEFGCKLDPELDVFEDWDFWLQCAEHTDFVHLDQISAGYRAGGGSNAGWGQSQAQVAEARQRLLAKWKTRWTATELDEALRWPQDRLLETQDAMGRTMEAHRDLHEKYQGLHESHMVLHEAHGTLSDAHSRLSTEHTELIEAHQGLESQHKDLLKAYRQLEDINRHLDFLHREASQAYAATLASTSWRITVPVRAVSRSAQGVIAAQRSAVGTVARVLATVSRARNVSGGWGRLFAKGLFRLKEDGVGGTVRRVRFHMQRSAPPQLVVGCSGAAKSFSPTDAELEKAPQCRCGLMVHVFFPDLIPELCGYLARLPSGFRLLVSVPSEEVRSEVLTGFASLGENIQVDVKIVPNRGRDIAPFFVAFRQEIAELEIVGHLHTKKSSYTGSSLFGDEWRRYLFDTMLGDARRVRAVLAQFEADPDVGFIYPETFPGLPYWAHTWLSNRGQGGHLLAALGFSDVDFGQYIDYPAGSMFWARTQALKPLLDLGFSLSDFPPEQGQTDKTLHHAIERCLAFSALAAGFGSRVHRLVDGRDWFHSETPFVLSQYAPHGLRERLRLGCKGRPLVSFDLFDTLILRPFARPEAVFWLLQEIAQEEFGLEDFANQRREADSVARSRLGPGQDVTLDAIYAALIDHFGLSPDGAERLKLLELEYESAWFSLNPAVAAAVRELKDAGQRLLLVSDMYLGKAHLRPILQRLGLDLFDRWYVSADTGRRKDRGDVWDYLLAEEGVEKHQLQHVGDNEHSDVQVLVDAGYSHPVHVMRPAALLGVLPGGRALIECYRQRPSWRNELVLGLIANRVNRQLTTAVGETTPAFAAPEVFGYAVLGPVVFAFIRWLIQELEKDKATSARFLSREGWLFERIYREMLAHPAVAGREQRLPAGSYFYCSRSVCGLAAIRDERDLGLLLGAHYDGSLRQLLTARFGMSDLTPIREELGESVLDQVFKLPEDHLKLQSYLRRCLPAMVSEAKDLRGCLRAYWAASAPDEDPRPAIIDVGYSGTIQLALMQALELPMKGYYVVTNASTGRVLDRGGDCASCFGHLLPLDQMDAAPIHRYSLLLEAVLTSPEGQLAGFDEHEGRPVPRLKPGGSAQQGFDVLAQMHDGVSEYCRDVLDAIGERGLGEGWDLDASATLLSLIAEQAIDIGRLADVLSVEDQYCGNQELSVLEFYERQRTP